MSDGIPGDFDGVEQAASPVKRLVSCDELREICKLTVDLARLRQIECKHLCIENMAPEMFNKLLLALVNCKASNSGVISPVVVNFNDIGN